MLLGLLVLAVAFGVIGLVVHGAGRTIAEVTVAGVTREPDSDRLWVELKIRMRGQTTCSWVKYDNGAVTATPAMQLEKDVSSVIDWYLRRSSPVGGLGFAFELKPGEEVEVHLPPSRSRWLRSGEDLVLVSSSRGGVEMRSVALRFEATEE